jgi:ABC-type multidrug transport system ATPase subunit
VLDGIDGIDGRLPGGAVTLVVGGNGSGKSTLLRTIAGASTPTAGRVIRPAGPIGYVPERLPADLRMTARQYARHMARLLGSPVVRRGRPSCSTGSGCGPARRCRSASCPGATARRSR